MPALVWFAGGKGIRKFEVNIGKQKFFLMI